MPMPPDLKNQFSRLAKEYGDVILVQACVEVISGFATIAAKKQLTERLGDPQERCPRCRERDANRKVYEQAIKRTTTNRAIGGTIKEDDY
ncbi:MAG TPA: hypothetical protein VFI91_01535 [Longimicrobiaceae bacterium]|nr:hypothetical protein [Longimicrobiaceae bacterium]